MKSQKKQKVYIHHDSSLFIVFDRIHTFLPSFISSTNELLNDKEKLQQQKIEKTKDEKINLRRIKESPGKYIYKTNVDPKNKDIELVRILEIMILFI